MIDDQRNIRCPQRGGRVVQLITFTLDVHLPAFFPSLREKPRHGWMLQHVDAVSEQIKTDTDYAGIVQIVERALVDIGRNARDAFETAVRAADCRDHASIVVAVAARRIDQ